MEIKIRNYVPRFQEGGEMPPAEGAPMEEAPMEGAPQGGGQDPMMQLVQMASQALQAQDCEAAMATCDFLLQLVQGAQGGPAPAQGEPVYRRGGTLSYRIRK